MKVLVALEDIGFSRVYAVKHDKLEFVKKHDDEFSVYRNLRTNELFITRPEQVAEMDDIGLLIFVEKEKKRKTVASHKGKNSGGNTNQSSLF